MRWTASLCCALALAGCAALDGEDARRDLATQTLLRTLLVELTDALQSSGGVSASLGLELSAAEIADVKACLFSEPGVNSGKCRQADSLIRQRVKLLSYEKDISAFESWRRAIWPYFGATLFAAAFIYIVRTSYLMCTRLSLTTLLLAAYAAIAALSLGIGANAEFVDKMDAELRSVWSSSCAAPSLWRFVVGGDAAPDDCTQQANAAFAKVIARLDYAKHLHTALLYPITLPLELLGVLGSAVHKMEHGLSESQAAFTRDIVRGLVIVVPIVALLRLAVQRLAHLGELLIRTRGQRSLSQASEHDATSECAMIGDSPPSYNSLSSEPPKAWTQAYIRDVAAASKKNA